jgi:hypothetical protein
MKKAGAISLGGLALNTQAMNVQKNLVQDHADKIDANDEDFMKVASLGNDQDNADCCTPLASVGPPLVAPTKEWVCGDLKKTYDAAMDQCGAKVGDFFTDLGIKDGDHQKYEINIAQNKAQINKWFKYYCHDHEEKSAKSVKSDKTKSAKSAKAKSVKSVKSTKTASVKSVKGSVKTASVKEPSNKTAKTTKTKKSHDDNGKHIGQGEEADDHDFEHKNFVEPEGGNHDVEDHADQYKAQIRAQIMKKNDEEKAKSEKAKSVKEASVKSVKEKSVKSVKEKSVKSVKEKSVKSV